MGAARRLDAAWRQAVAATFRALRDSVFPARCLECRDELHAPDRERLDEAGAALDALRLLRPFFCPSCLQGVMPLGSPLCPRCGVMFKGLSGDDHLCGRCLQQPPPFHMARAAFLYDRSLVDVIHCFKYKGKVQLAAPLGRLLWQAYLRFWDQDRVDAILPIPLHAGRLRNRGFNQAELLVRKWPQLPGSRDLPPVTDGVLRRARPTPPQAGLGRREREANIRGAFVVRQPERISGRHLLLVDDVVTTGATAGECAQLLLASGAARVDVLALARVI